MNKKRLIALIVIAAVLAGTGVLYAWKGDELMGLTRGQSKSKVSKLPWYCETVGSNRNSNNSGGSGQTKSSSNRFISPDTFKKIHSLGPSGSEFWEFGQYYGGSIIPGTGNSGGATDFEIPEFNVTEDDDAGDEFISVTCSCPAYSWNDGRITVGIGKDVYYSEFGGSNEKVCEVYASDQDCANPVTVTCTCNKEKKTNTLSSWQFENWYDNSSEKLCDSYYSEFDCNPRWWCPTGSQTDYQKIFDACGKMWDSKKMSCALETCPELGFDSPPPVDPKAEEFCKVFYGDYWAENLADICGGISASDCPSMEDCAQYKEWFDADVSTGEMLDLLEKSGKSGEEASNILNVCGWFF
jgi:hypothetical protein